MKSNYDVLGKYIAPCDELNSEGELTLLQGISNEKYFQGCKSNTNDIDLTRYRICRKGWFCYNRATTRNGEKISIAYREEEDCLVSPSYKCFKIVDENKLDPIYLLLWFKRPEFDRYARFMSHGSAHEYFEYEQMCDVVLPVPSIEEQRKIVANYRSLEHRISLLSQINDNLAETANTLFCKFFITNEEKKTWEEGSFSQMLLETVGGDWGQETPSGNYTCEVSCIRGTDIPALNLGSVSDAPTRYILEKNFNTKRICANDMVVEISGGSPIQATGRIALVPERILSYRGSNIICSNFCRVMKVDADYLYFFLQNWLYLYRNGVMFNYENSSTGLKNFNFAAFTEEHPILIPPKELAVRFNSLIEPIYKEIVNIGFEIEQLKRTQEHILPHMMSVGI